MEKAPGAFPYCKRWNGADERWGRFQRGADSEKGQRISSEKCGELCQLLFSFFYLNQPRENKGQAF